MVVFLTEVAHDVNPPAKNVLDHETKHPVNFPILLENHTPLHLAAQQGHLEIVQWLANFDQALKFKTISGLTPCDLAVKFDLQSVVNFLHKQVNFMNTF